MPVFGEKIGYFIGKGSAAKYRPLLFQELIGAFLACFVILDGEQINARGEVFHLDVYFVIINHLKLQRHFTPNNIMHTEFDLLSLGSLKLYRYKLDGRIWKKLN